jgi:sugar lactone lactonase YvrE
MSGLMARLVSEWEDISVTPQEYVVEGDRVVVFGRYKETWKATGRTLDIPFVHSWTVNEGKLVVFQQYTDTAALVETMGERPGINGPAEQAQAYEQVAMFPADRSLVRPEDGVMLADGTLLIADQVHGLVALDAAGDRRPFGDFAAAGYVHEPPERSAGPNGVAMEPDGIHVLVADVFTGAIYRVHTGNERVRRIHQHEFGVNSARRDRAGALWFTQSTENIGPESEARMFAAVDSMPLDGALYRLGPTDDHEPLPDLRRMAVGLSFANGLAIDEARGEVYVAETMANRIVAYPLSMRYGSLPKGRVVAELPTPDNIELDAVGRLWVASPIANALLVVDPESGQWSTAFRPETPENQRLVAEWSLRGQSGQSRLALFGPDMWAPLPGLITGLILTQEGGPIYLTGLGNALVKLEKSE